MATIIINAIIMGISTARKIPRNSQRRGASFDGIFSLSLDGSGLSSDGSYLSPLPPTTASATSSTLPEPVPGRVFSDDEERVSRGLTRDGAVEPRSMCVCICLKLLDNKRQ